MLKKILCKLTGGHRFQGRPITFIDENEIVHYQYSCIKCGKMCEWTIPWISIWNGYAGVNSMEEVKH